MQDMTHQYTEALCLDSAGNRSTGVGYMCTHVPLAMCVHALIPLAICVHTMLTIGYMCTYYVNHWLHVYMC